MFSSLEVLRTPIGINLIWFCHDPGVLLRRTTSKKALTASSGDIPPARRQGWTGLHSRQEIRCTVWIWSVRSKRERRCFQKRHYLTATWSAIFHAQKMKNVTFNRCLKSFSSTYQLLKLFLNVWLLYHCWAFPSRRFVLVADTCRVGGAGEIRLNEKRQSASNLPFLSAEELLPNRNSENVSNSHWECSQTHGVFEGKRKLLT